GAGRRRPHPGLATDRDRADPAEPGRRGVAARPDPGPAGQRVAAGRRGGSRAGRAAAAVHRRARGRRGPAARGRVAVGRARRRRVPVPVRRRGRLRAPGRADRGGVHPPGRAARPVTSPYALPAIVAVTLVTVVIGAYGLRLARTTSDFLVASRSVTPRWNAAAISGEYLSAA